MNIITPTHRFSTLDILSGDKVALVDPYFRQALDFCKAWISGTKEFVLHTSGSTGKPKAIKISRAQMEASASLTQKVLPLQDYNTALVSINTNFVGGTMMLVRGMIFDWDLYLVQPSNHPFASMDQDVTIDFVALVPSQLYHILKDLQSSQRLQGFQSVIVGGGAVSLDLLQQIQQHPTPIYHTYGMTETVSHIALQCLNTSTPDPYFSAIEGVQIGQDERGCLVIDTPTSIERVVTNDCVDLIDDASFKVLGRIDNVVNSGGIKIQLEQLEQQISQLFASHQVSNAFYLQGEDDSILGTRLVMYLEGPSDTEVITSLFESLPKYHRPKGIYTKAQFERTETGKIKRDSHLV